MKLQFSPLVTSVSGRFGGLVFSSWQGVPLARIFRRPAQPRTAAQVAHRNAFRNLLRFYGRIPAIELGSTPPLNDVWKQSWANLASRQPGQARNFFIAEPLKSETPTLDGLRWFGSSVVEAPPDFGTASTTSVEINFTVGGGGAPPPGYTGVGYLVALMDQGIAFTGPTLPPYTLKAVAIHTGDSGSFPGLTKSTKYELHAARIYANIADPGNNKLMRLSAEAVIEVTTPAS